MRFLFLFSLVVCGSVLGQKSTFYNTLKGSNKELLLKQLESLPFTKNSNLKKGYEGAINCKIASCEKTPKNKLDYFKKGALQLEEAIKKDENNIELRFLRLLIQENAPPIVKYNKDIKKDCLFIKEHFIGADAELKKIMLDYTKSSANLKI